MNTRIALLLALTLPGTALAQEFLGATKALERYTAETARPAPAATMKVSVAEWQARARAYAQAAPGLAPQEAARRWLALCDEWRTLPADPDAEARHRQRKSTRTFSALLGILPPPAAWEALDAAIVARPATGDAAIFNLSLRLLSTALRGDRAALAGGTRELRTALGKLPFGAQLANHTLREIEAWIAGLRDDPKEVVARLEEQLAAAESSDGSSDLAVPDLVTLADAARAEALLRRALAAPGVELRVETGDATRALAVRLATHMSAELKKGQWSLIRGISPADVALYEALEKRFPRKEDEDLHFGERAQAERYYLLGLIAAKRTTEATALATQIGERGSDGASFFGHGEMSGLLKAGFTAEVQAFLRSVLASRPELPFWEEYIRIAAQAGQASAALAFLRETAARGDLSAAARELVRTHLASALLAADEVDAGVKLLREELAAKVALLDAAPAPVRRGRYALSYSTSPSVEAGSTALRLCTLGRLLEQPELLEEGLQAARKSIAASQRDPNRDNHNYSGQVAELLLTLGRAAEAERLLIDDWIADGRRPPAADSDERGAPLQLIALATLYHRTSRPEDVLVLLAQAPGWGAGDLGAILGQSILEHIPLGHVAASALAAVGRKHEARRVALRLLEEQGGYDPAYEFLHRLGGAERAAPLDRLAARDRFEERPLIWKAQLLLEAGQLAEAEQTARAAIAIDPSDGEQGKGTRMRVYAVLGDILEKKGDAAQAKIMRGAVAAIRLSETADDWWEAGLLSRAVRKYEEALGLFADAYCIQSRLALRSAELGDFAKAETHYQRAYELMPESFGRVESHCFGCEGAFTGERAQGIADRVFTRLAERMPAKPQVFYLLGYLRTAQQRYLEAAEQLRRAVKLDPDYLNAWSQLAGLAQRIALPHAEREAAALALVRLDPLGKHRGLGSSTSGEYSRGQYGEIADFRALWTAFAAGVALAPDTAAVLLALPASQARLEEQRKAAGESAPNVEPAASGAKRSASEALAEHAFLMQLAGLMQTAIEL